MDKAEFKIGQEVYGVSRCSSNRINRKFIINCDPYYDSIMDCWMYTDSSKGHWPEGWLRRIEDVIFCAECGKEEFPNCGVDISSSGSVPIKVHWKCYFNNVSEQLRLKRKYSDNSGAMIALSENDMKLLSKK